LATTAEGELRPDLPPDQYTVEREIGRGGMATVYAAQDRKHGRRVALKVLRTEIAASLGVERFRREITLAASLQHPHIVSVYDSGETPSGALWFTMPLVEGESLRERLRRQHQLSVEDAVRITREVALALDYAHRHGVIHRDIKPENILLVDGQAMVADFGVAKTHTAAPAGETLTATGIAIGTPAYMSPEQAAGERALGASTDIYSLGAVCYEMLTGEPPFPGPTAQAIAAKMRSGEAPSIRRLRPAVPESVEEVVRKALAPVPADRYATAEDFSKALEAAERTALVSGSRAQVVQTPPRWPVIAWSLLGLLIVAGAFFFWRTRQGGTSTVAGPVRIAVLPFENLGDSADNYFADGMTDEIRGKLAGLPTLEVISSASSDQYRRTTKSQEEIGRELKVRYLLVGRVRWSKPAGGVSRVRVEPELVQVANVGTPTSRWEAPFDAPLTDVFQVQGDIARQVASALQIRLTPAAQQTLAARPTENLDAYVAYLRGEEIARVGDDLVSVRRMIGAYRQAIGLDSSFALAWVGLSEAYIQRMLLEPGEMTRDSARIASQKALALAPDLPRAQAVMSGYYAMVEHDYPRALALDSIALERSPNDARLLYAAGITDLFAGRPDAAVARFERATSVDPRFADAFFNLGVAYLNPRHCAQARAAYDRALELEPAALRYIQGRAEASICDGDLAGARAVLHAARATVDEAELVAYMAANGGIGDDGWMLDSAQEQLLLSLPPSAFNNDLGTWAMVRAQQHSFHGDTAQSRVYAQKALPALEADVKQAPNDPSRHLMLGLALAYLGQKDRAIREGERGAALVPISKDAVFGTLVQLELANIYVRVGELEKSLDVLEALLRVPSNVYSPAWLRIDPKFAALRGNPRFEKLTAATATR
jgi:serine/threonine-protein kinase